MLGRVHTAVLQQRLRYRNVENGLVVRIKRVDDCVVVSSDLGYAGRVLRPVDALTIDSGLKRVLVLNDVARPGRGARPRRCSNIRRLTQVPAALNAGTGKEDVLRRLHVEAGRRLDLQVHVEVRLRLNDAITRDSYVRGRNGEVVIFNE